MALYPTAVLLILAGTGLSTHAFGEHNGAPVQGNRPPESTHFLVGPNCALRTYAESLTLVPASDKNVRGFDESRCHLVIKTRAEYGVPRDAPCATAGKQLCEERCAKDAACKRWLSRQDTNSSKRYSSFEIRDCDDDALRKFTNVVWDVPADRPTSRDGEELSQDAFLRQFNRTVLSAQTHQHNETGFPVEPVACAEKPTNDTTLQNDDCPKGFRGGVKTTHVGICRAIVTGFNQVAHGHHQLAVSKQIRGDVLASATHTCNYVIDCRKAVRVASFGKDEFDSDFMDALKPRKFCRFASDAWKSLGTDYCAQLDKTVRDTELVQPAIIPLFSRKFVTAPLLLGGEGYPDFNAAVEKECKAATGADDADKKHPAYRDRESLELTLVEKCRDKLNNALAASDKSLRAAVSCCMPN